MIQGCAPQRDIPKVPYMSNPTQAPTSNASYLIMGADPTALPEQTLVYPIQPPTLVTGLQAGSQTDIDVSDRAYTATSTRTTRSHSAHAEAEVDPDDVEERHRKRRRTEHPPGWYARKENGGEGWDAGS